MPSQDFTSLSLVQTPTNIHNRRPRVYPTVHVLSPHVPYNPLVYRINRLPWYPLYKNPYGEPPHTLRKSSLVPRNNARHGINKTQGWEKRTKIEEEAQKTHNSHPTLSSSGESVTESLDIFCP